MTYIPSSIMFELIYFYSSPNLTYNVQNSKNHLIRYSESENLMNKTNYVVLLFIFIVRLQKFYCKVINYVILLLIQETSKME